MTPPIFSVIDGIQREVTSIPVAIDGVQRELDSMTAMIDGVEREIFSRETKWNKYSVNVKTTYNQVLLDSSYRKYADYTTNSYIAHLYSACTLDPSTGKFNLSGDQLTVKATPQTSSNEGKVQDLVDSTTTWWWDGKLGASGIPKESNHANLETVVKVDPSRMHGSKNEITWYGYRYGVTSTTTRSQGTFIETVSSKDPAAYPDNGEQDGYWYVKI